MDKPFLTYEEQIEKLLSKNLIISDKTYAVHVLKKYGYYSLICGYKEPFKNKTTKNYIDGTSIEDIVRLYEFDMELRELFLRYLLLVEKRIKVCLANAFCERYGDKENAYLDRNNYDYSKKNQRGIDKLIRTLKTSIDNEQYAYIEHAKTNHNNVPLWVLFNAITFGSVSKMYQLQKSDVKARVAMDYNLLNEGNLGALLQISSRCRNTCAHGERLFSFRYKEAIPKMKLHDKLGITVIGSGNEYQYGQKDLFAVVIALRYLLDNTDFQSFKKKLVKLIDGYSKDADSNIFNKVIECMGFPFNWKDITKYRKL